MEKLEFTESLTLKKIGEDFKIYKNKKIFVKNEIIVDDYGFKNNEICSCYKLLMLNKIIINNILNIWIKFKINFKIKIVILLYFTLLTCIVYNFKIMIA